MTSPTAAPPSDEPTAVVHVIQSSYHSRGGDGQPVVTSQILRDEGWFDDPTSAQTRSAQLNAQNRALYDVEMARAEREHNAKISAAQERNREAKILRDNGVHKRDVPVPKPFVAVPFEDFVPDRAYTTYEVLTISRSEHDGIAQANI